MNQFPALPPLFPDIHSQKITAYFESLTPKKGRKIGFLSSTNNSQSQLNSFDFTKLRGAFFLCFTNRCGSNYLAQAISSDGRLPQVGENINFDAVINQSSRLGFTSFTEYFLWLSNSVKGKEGLFGCKTSVGQLLFLYNEGLLSQFASTPKFIHVVRKDVIAQAVSLYIANKTNQWTSEQLGANEPVDYDKESLISIVNGICIQNAAFQSIFQLFGVSPLVVYYENFVETPRKLIKKIGDYLEVENLSYVGKAIKYKKQADERNKLLILQLRNEFKL